jgi:DNA-binding transcriptional regulator YdaS (Cro superfamily)
MPNLILTELETHTDLGPTFAARLLGVAYPTYAQYRSGRRELPQYHSNHIQALLLLSPVALRQLIKEHLREST